jgi:hypothetical protein
MTSTPHNKSPMMEQLIHLPIIGLLDKYFKLALKLSKSESTISGSTGFF